MISYKFQNPNKNHILTPIKKSMKSRKVKLEIDEEVLMDLLYKIKLEPKSNKVHLELKVNN